MGDNNMSYKEVLEKANNDFAKEFGMKEIDPDELDKISGGRDPNDVIKQLDVLWKMERELYKEGRSREYILTKLWEYFKYLPEAFVLIAYAAELYDKMAEEDAANIL